MATEQKVLAGRYQIDSVVGHGGMAEVYRGTDRVLGRQVAVKVLAPQFSRDTSFVARFRREAQAAASLNHPNVVNVFDTGSDDATHFIVLEFIHGKTLADLIREQGPLPPTRAAAITSDVAAALGFAHRQGIIHRDVKPGNIMLTEAGDVKVTDFGIARATTSDSLTQTATVLGTATYFSPEQAQGERVDARSDLYSLGCVVYEMLTGQPPFSGDSPVAVAYKHVKEEPVPPSRLNADVPTDLDAVVMKLMAKDPKDRYGSADELRADLRRFLEGAPVVAAPPVPLARTELLERPTRPTTVLPAPTPEETERPRRWLAWVVLLAILALIGVGLFFLARSLLAPEELVTVTNVKGKPLRSAKFILTQQGFEPVVAGHVNSRLPEGFVVDYSPKRAPLDSQINLVVSKGPAVEKVEVPFLECLPFETADERLRDAGLSVDVAGEEESASCLDEGTVARTNPPAGTRVPKGSVVHVFLVSELVGTTPPPTTPSPTTPSPTTPPPTTPPTTTPAPTTPPTTTPSAAPDSDEGRT